MAGPMKTATETAKRQNGHSGKLVLAAAVSSVFVLATAQDAYAQVGIGVSPSTTATGTIGHNKMQSDSAPFRCPEGTVGVGLRHRDKTNQAPLQSTRGMTTYFGAFCADIVPTTTGVNVVPRSTTTPSVGTNYGYNFQGSNIDGLCGTGQVIHRLGGYDRDWDQSTQYPAWTSALTIVCDPVTKNANDWVRIGNTNPTPILVGIIEPPPTSAYPGHVERGPFCTTADTSIVTGLYAQAGGEGIDGVNVYCGTLQQARFSAQMTFTDFAWDKTLGTGGWLVNLNRNGTLLANTAGMTGQARTPYALNGNNANAYSVPHEVYVVPNGGYGATVNARPTGIAANTYYLSGTCVSGYTLANEIDGSCTLNVEGLPDLTPSVTSPATTYTAYNENQNMTIGVSNLGPGAVVAADGYTIDATLPAGWTAGPLPTGCTLVGQIVRCSVPGLTAAATPGATGGAASWTFPVRATTSNNGTFTVPVVVNTSVPNADGNPANDDYNSANNSVNGQVILNRAALLRLSKVWANAVVNDQANLTATSSSGPTASLASVANTASETDNGATVQAPLSAVYNLSEVLPAANIGLYTASAWTCTGGTLSGTALTIRQQDLEQTITCSITNTRQSADISVTKTASPTTVRSGQDITWTIVASNNGPAAANGATLTDTPGAGMDCTTPPPPPPTCTTTGGAACPGTYTASALASGVIIPTFPSGSTVTITMTCRATASGL